MELMDRQKCGDFEREVDFHFELYRHLVNWLGGLYGEDIGNGVNLSELGKKIVKVVPEDGKGAFERFLGKRTDLAFYTMEKGNLSIFCPVEVKKTHVRPQYARLKDFRQGAEQAFWLGANAWFGLCSTDNFVLVDSFRLFGDLKWDIEEFSRQCDGLDWKSYILEEISLAETECKEATREILLLLHSKCFEETEE